ncbi:MAG: hypothetical protein C4308_04060 [Chitinophagaceae bacterium]
MTPEQRSLNRRVEIQILRLQPETTVDTPDEQTKNLSIEKQLTDTVFNEGDNIVLKNLNFFGGRHVLLPGSEETLEELLALLNRKPNLKIEIQGYVCCTPASSDGLDLDTKKPDLSVQRAKMVYDYLVEMGIEKTRLSYKGFGGNNKIIEDENTEYNRMLNRRVEIKIVGK